MASQPYYPVREGDQLTWFTNLQAQAATYPATPTKWTYKAIYRVGDHQVGQWSAETSLIVGG